MATKANFTEDEWQQLLVSVMMSGMAVSVADPSGLWGMVKEGMASGRSIVEAKAGSSDLIKAVAADLETSEGRSAVQAGLRERLSGLKGQEIKAPCIETLKQASAIVDAKAPEDAAEFKLWLKRVSERVAETAKEGGFLGFGGVRGERRRKGDNRGGCARTWSGGIDTTIRENPPRSCGRPSP